ncbi:META domain-containing protein [Shewanella sp. KJ2020]|uniref:META domain-containing protein n=1 Tax=Shewanella sp. KJ2020 TaxID=2919172 RepID=UPI0020A7B1FB|nr:META domain-containing protein [Shewanella sp. KJ2020]MCP3129782.1 META domain-containing protein [Shewanella sp. KJ2020]
MLKQTFLLSALLFGLTACQSTDVTNQDTVPLQGSWHIEVVQGQPTIDYSPAQITFDAEGKLHGNNSCNNFFGQYTQQGQELKLMPAGSTMKACVDALMQQEHKVMQAMPLVAKAKLQQGRLTLLSSDDKPVLVLSQVK